jgi:hypothetical protein
MSYKTDSYINTRAKHPNFRTNYYKELYYQPYEDEEDNHECMYAHGTSLFSLTQACKYTNAQFTCGKELRKYNLPITSGENLATSNLNYKYVSAINLSPSWFSYIHGAVDYANRARKSDEKHLMLHISAMQDFKLFLCPEVENNDSNAQAIKSLFANPEDTARYNNLSKIGIIVLGDAPVDENNKVEKIKVRSSIKFEVGIKRLNTRIVLCHDNHYENVVNELNKFPEFNFRVLSYNHELITRLSEYPEQRLKIIRVARENTREEMEEFNRITSDTKKDWEELKKLADVC